jgi:hypothetical protein
MRKFGILPGLALFAMSLAAFSSAATAGSLAGRSSSTPGMTSGVGTIGGGASVPTAGLYSQSSTIANNPVYQTSYIAAPSSGPNNIDNSHYIDASNNISVNNSVNGNSVNYGGNGASLNWPQSTALDVINGFAGFNANIIANDNATANTVEDFAVDVAQSQQSSGN